MALMCIPAEVPVFRQRGLWTLKSGQSDAIMSSSSRKRGKQTSAKVVAEAVLVSKRGVGIPYQSFQPALLFAFLRHALEAVSRRISGAERLM